MYITVHSSPQNSSFLRISCAVKKPKAPGVETISFLEPSLPLYSGRGKRDTLGKRSAMTCAVKPEVQESCHGGTWLPAGQTRFPYPGPRGFLSCLSRSNLSREAATEFSGRKHTYVQDWTQVLFFKYFIYDWVICHFHITSYLTKVCVFWWTLINEDTLWCLSWGACISFEFEIAGSSN